MAVLDVREAAELEQLRQDLTKARRASSFLASSRERAIKVAAAAIAVCVFAVPTCISRGRTIDANERYIDQLQEQIDEAWHAASQMTTEACEALADFVETVARAGSSSDVLPSICLTALDPDRAGPPLEF